ncbi:MAG TPA: type 4a pilus biogenesis protein PilO, partial [Polyangiaceae bacterium LLY-WYZ-14_1]|nr:type 4a pilus biogenesis protein PilO [Polyangiaceae bacterium LLY-WYZ-14_1]
MASPGLNQELSFAALPLGAKVFLLVLLLGVVSALYYFSFLLPLTDQIDGARATNLRLQSELQQAQARQREYLELSGTLADREALDRRNRRILPEEAEIATFLGDLNRLAELSGLEIRLVEPRPEEPDQMYVQIPVNLQLAGRYHQVARFFYNASRLERVIGMENLRMTEPEVRAEEVLLEVEVLATTYRRPSS